LKSTALERRCSCGPAGACAPCLGPMALTIIARCQDATDSRASLSAGSLELRCKAAVCVCVVACFGCSTAKKARCSCETPSSSTGGVRGAAQASPELRGRARARQRRSPKKANGYAAPRARGAPGGA
jgi:hypothetical protein